MSSQVKDAIIRQINEARRAGLGLVPESRAKLCCVELSQGKSKMSRNSRQPREIWRGVTRPKVWERDNHQCQSPLRPPICTGKPSIGLLMCHIDHIIPHSHGGKNVLPNLRVLCPACHVLRADNQHRGMIAKALEKGIIPPNWRELVWE